MKKSQKSFLGERLHALETIIDKYSIDSFIFNSTSALTHFADTVSVPAYIVLSHKSFTYLTDKRFEEEVQSLAPHIELLIYKNSIWQFISQNGLLQGKNIGFEGNALTSTQFNSLQSIFPNKKFIDVSSDLGGIFNCYDQEMLQRMKRAIRNTFNAYSSCVEQLREGITEREVYASFSGSTIVKYPDGISFEPIIAFGANASKPHAKPGTKKLKHNMSVLIDVGLKYKGICADFTRTNWFGNKPGTFFTRIKKIIDEIMSEIADKLLPGMPVKEIDLFVKQKLKNHSLDRYFTHATGHGLGYEVHQSPRISEYSPELLTVNSVVTIEPGIYIPGKIGYRHENIYFIGQDKTLNLTEF